jgi:hypothetical protein
LLNVKVLWDSRSWVGLVMTDFDLVTLGLSLVMQRVRARSRLSLRAGILCNMLGGTASSMIVSFVWSGDQFSTVFFERVK